jgi:ABC-type lipoprotein release transport system permease subunit
MRLLRSAIPGVASPGLAVYGIAGAVLAIASSLAAFAAARRAAKVVPASLLRVQ